MKDGRECSNEKQILLAAGMSFQNVFKFLGDLLALHQIGQQAAAHRGRGKNYFGPSLLHASNCFGGTCHRQHADVRVRDRLIPEPAQDVESADEDQNRGQGQPGPDGPEPLD
jgi:hypothetical protein